MSTLGVFITSEGYHEYNGGYHDYIYSWYPRSESVELNQIQRTAGSTGLYLDF